MATYSQNFEQVDNLLTFDAIGYLIVDDSHDGFSKCIKMRGIGDSGLCYFTITLEVGVGGGTVSFWRKVSSENGYDKLKFYVDGSSQGNWSGSVAWSQVSFTLSAGTHILKWEYSKDSSAASGSDTAWITGIDVSNVTSDLSGMYTTDGYADYSEDFEGDSVPDGWVGSWALATDWAYSGSKSLKSNAIGDGASTSVTYAFDAHSAGIATIHAKVSSESYDRLTVYIDNILLGSANGNPAYIDVSCVIPAGAHTFKATYLKDSNTSAGSDCAWIDLITFPYVNAAITPPSTAKRRFAQII